jgi:hypothetical protein
MNDLETARTELADLEADLPKLEALLEQHQAATENAQRIARGDFSKISDATKAESNLNAVKSMLEQHCTEIEQVRVKVSELEQQAEIEQTRERILENIRTFRKAEAKQKTLYQAAENAVARAALAGEELSNIGNAASGQAVRDAEALVKVQIKSEGGSVPEELDLGQARMLASRNVGDMVRELLVEIAAGNGLEHFTGERLDRSPPGHIFPALSLIEPEGMCGHYALDPLDIVLE